MHRPVPVARKLRREATLAERKLWGALNRRQVAGFKFRRQVTLTRYIVDFACLEARLIVEIDGATHSTQEELLRDSFREQNLRAMGFDILRFQNAEVFENLEGVAETIRLKVRELRPRVDDRAQDSPPPCGEGLGEGVARCKEKCRDPPP